MDIMHDLKYKVKELQEKNEELQVELEILKEQWTLYGVMQRFFKIIVFLISIAFIVLIGLDVIIYQFPKWIITGKELELRLNTWGRLMDYVLNVA